MLETATQHIWAHNWAGEFKGPAQELAFRRDIWVHNARNARLFTIWASLLFIFASVANNPGAGPPEYFYQMIAVRLLVPLVAVWPYLEAKKPQYSRRSDISLAVYCCFAGLVQSYGVYAWPVEVDLPFYGVLSMGLVFWLFVPVGLVWRIIQNAVLNIAFVTAYSLGGHDLDSPRFLTALVALISINVLGFITVRQFNISRRVQYHNTFQIAEAEENYRQVVENATESILVVQDGRLVMANPRAQQVSGYSEEELIGSPLERFLLPENRDELKEYARRRIIGESVPDTYQIQLVMAEGRLRWFEVSGVRIQWKGRPAVLYFLVDIDPRLKAQAEENELAKMQGVMEMAGAASHEVNQPLQILATLTALAKVEAPADSPVQARLAAMDEALERLRLLTHKIQRISRYETMDYLEETRIIDIDKASE